MGDIDLVRLPSEVREHLAQLDLELSEGTSFKIIT